MNEWCDYVAVSCNSTEPGVENTAGERKVKQTNLMKKKTFFPALLFALIAICSIASCKKGTTNTSTSLVPIGTTVKLEATIASGTQGGSKCKNLCVKVALKNKNDKYITTEKIIFIFSSPKTN